MSTDASLAGMIVGVDCWQSMSCLQVANHIASGPRTVIPEGGLQIELVHKLEQLDELTHSSKLGQVGMRRRRIFLEIEQNAFTLILDSRKCDECAASKWTLSGLILANHADVFFLSSSC